MCKELKSRQRGQRMIDYKHNSSGDSLLLSTNYSSESSKFPCKVVFNGEHPESLGINYYLPMIIAATIISLLTVISNGAFLFVASRSKRLQTVHNTLLISLSITDFFTGAAVTPIVAVSFTFLMDEKYPCVLFWFWLTLLSAASLISIFILALISFERYLAIMHTYYYERVVTKRKLIIMTLAVWTLGTALPLVGYFTRLISPKTARNVWSYLPCLSATLYVAIFYCYGRMFKEIQRVRRRISVENTYHNGHTALQQSSKTAKTMVLVIAALTLCYLPLMILYILNYWAYNLKSRKNCMRS